MDLPYKQIGIIGSGNVAYAFAKAMSVRNMKTDCILVHSREKMEIVESELNVHAVSDYSELFSCDMVVVAVKDDAIAEVASRLTDYQGMAVHTSGTMPAEALRCKHHGVLYPLQTISKEKDLNFDTIPLLIYSYNADDLEKLRTFAENLSKNVTICSDEQRKYIHLAAVFASNFLNVVLQCSSKILQDNNMSLSLMEPLVKETVEKAFRLGPQQSLTGPARRRDLSTIEKHLSLIEDDKAVTLIYKTLTDYILNVSH